MTTNGKSFVFFDLQYELQMTRNPENFKKKHAIVNERREKRFVKLLSENKGAILLSHAPPYGYLDKIHSEKHVGSKTLLRAIKRFQPPLVLCGHIHEAKGEARIGKTKVYNLGCCGDYKIIEA